MAPVLASSLNQKADGYRGIWAKTGKPDSSGRYKYSGGMATYSEKHQPFAVYCESVQKTFFCYGGAAPGNNQQLYQMVSYYDHKTGTLPRPTIVLNKHTSDAQDNPVISIDRDGYIWLMSSSFGLARPSYIHRSKKPYDIGEFEMLSPKRNRNGRDLLIDNFSFMQSFNTDRYGFLCLFTNFGDVSIRTSFFMRSRDGFHWQSWKRLAAIERGHYQVASFRDGKIATMMNYHPNASGHDGRTNLYYLESIDGGSEWRSADGATLDLPLTKPMNAALVKDYESEGLLVYLKDLQIDSRGNPVLLYLTSRASDVGPKGEPRVWRVARWTSKDWVISKLTSADHNYDMGSLYLDSDKDWRVIAPTAPGPQKGAMGGEMEMWISKDQGKSWKKSIQLTQNSKYNHMHARRPVNAHPDFYAFWSDGDTLAPSESRLYFCTREGAVYRLPRNLGKPSAAPELVLRSDTTSP